MIIVQDPDGGGGTGGGGGGLPTSPWVTINPASISLAVGGQPATLVVSWGNQSGTPTLTPATGAQLSNGGAVVVNPSVTTTYTLTGPSGGTATCTVTVGAPSSAVVRYADVNWAFSEPFPSGSVVGFDILFYLGGEPASMTNWVEPPIRVGSADRRLVYPLRLIPPQVISVAVRPVYEYGGRTGAWVSAASLTFQ